MPLEPFGAFLIQLSDQKQTAVRLIGLKDSWAPFLCEIPEFYLNVTAAKTRILYEHYFEAIKCSHTALQLHL